MIRHLTLLCLFFAVSLSGHAEILIHEGTSFHVYRVDPDKDTVQLFLGESKGKPNTFPQLQERLEKQGRRLKFAMNAGIFEGNFLPTGLHIADGKTVTPLNLDDFVKASDGELTPNFFLKPNGVFFFRKDGSAAILESARFAAAGESPRLATQSGPLLVENGVIHPALGPDSTSTRLRNGVGVTRKGEVIFVSSVMDQTKGRSNLYRFASFFRDQLDCPNALYLDGDISYIYLRGETADITETNWFAGILAITEPTP